MAGRNHSGREVSPIDLTQSPTVHVYWYSLNPVDDDFLASEIKHYLTECELERANRFKVKGGKALYISGRMLLRSLLSDRLNIQPRQIPVTLSKRGKPYLKQSQPPTYFNISHCDSTLVVAITEFANVGVDVEQVREKIRIFDLAERVLCAEELTVFRSLGEFEQASTFYKYWVLKESFVKMSGDGIVYGLDKIHFDWQKPQLIAPKDESQTLYLASPPGTYAALTLDKAAGRNVNVRPATIGCLSEYLSARHG